MPVAKQGVGCLNCHLKLVRTGTVNQALYLYQVRVTQGFGTETGSIPGFLFFAFSQRQGRCDIYATEFDLEAEEYVPLPKGDVHKKKEIIQDVTLHDLDVANARPQVSDSTDEIFTEKLFDIDVMVTRIIKEI